MEDAYDQLLDPLEGDEDEGVDICPYFYREKRFCLKLSVFE